MITFPLVLLPTYKPALFIRQAACCLFLVAGYLFLVSCLSGTRAAYPHGWDGTVAHVEEFISF